MATSAPPPYVLPYWPTVFGIIWALTLIYMVAKIFHMHPNRRVANLANFRFAPVLGPEERQIDLLHAWSQMLREKPREPPLDL